MACSPFYQMLRRADVLLPEPLSGWVHRHWLAPHTSGCPECRDHLDRMARLNRVLRQALLGNPAPYTAPAVMSAVPPPPAWPRICFAGVALAAACAAVFVARQPRATSRLADHRTHPVEKVRPHIPGPDSTTITRRDLPRPPAPRAVTIPNAVAAYASSRPPAPPAQRGTDRPITIDETCYLDGRDEALSAYWYSGGRRTASGNQPLVIPEDDFISLPPVQVAAADVPPGLLRQAQKQQEQQARIVDPRLARKVTLQLKAASLEELCEDLARQSMVRLRASRGVQDEKVTVFVKDRPVRDVMRAVARLFGYLWGRTGEEGAYRYELVQDLKSQLAEEEMRNEDFHAALLAMDAQMKEYAPYLGLSPDELGVRLQTAKGAERERLTRLAGAGGWGSLQLYSRLSPAEHAALASGQQFYYSLEHPNPERRLPAEWREPLLSQHREHVGLPDGTIGPVTKLPGANPRIGLRIDRSELGQLSLVRTGSIHWKTPEGGEPGLGSDETMATGRSPSATRPENARANASLRAQPAFQQVVSLKPRPSCPRLLRGETVPKPPAGYEVGPRYGDPAAEVPHVSTAEVWEAVHRETGLPVVADYYTHVYPVSRVTVERSSLFDALCRAGDELGVRWRKDGEFLLVRSTGYFWNKLKEVPNRLLRRWREDARHKGGLPLEDLLEIGSLSDQHLDSRIVGAGVRHCEELDEWRLPAGQPTYAPLRPLIRFLATLTSAQLARTRSAEGLPFAGLQPGQQAQLAPLTHAPLDQLGGGSLKVDYVPAGWHLWLPKPTSGEEQEELQRMPLAGGKTPEQALTAARRLKPGATPEQILPSVGVLQVQFRLANGEVRTFGKPNHDFYKLGIE